MMGSINSIFGVKFGVILDNTVDDQAFVLFNALFNFLFNSLLFNL